MLLLDREVSLTTTPLGDGRDGPSKARTASSECHPKRSWRPCFLPVHGKSKKVEGRPPVGVAVARRLKTEAPTLLRVEGQTEFPKPFPKLAPDLLRQAAREAVSRGIVTKDDLTEVKRALRGFGGLAA